MKKKTGKNCYELIEGYNNIQESTKVEKKRNEKKINCDRKS